MTVQTKMANVATTATTTTTMKAKTELFACSWGETSPLLEACLG
jgi:hypothetical protein